MKRKIHLRFISISFIVAVLITTAVQSNSGGAPNGHTGAPGEANCTNCHSGSALGNAATITTVLFNGQPITEYRPGTTYDVVMNISEQTGQRFGFSGTFKNSSNVSAGNIGATNMRARLSTQGQSQYITHTSSGIIPTSPGNNSWSFDWTAPTAGTGPISFHYANLVANGNGGTSGDRVFTSSIRLTEGVGTNVVNFEEKKANVFPNPVVDNVSFSFFLDKPINAQVELLGLDGKLISILQPTTDFLPGHQLLQLRIPAHLPNNMYLIGIGSAIVPTRIIVAR